MIKAIVTDIEGTTSSLSFVKDVLFPYARQHMERFVNENADDPQVAKLLERVCSEVGKGLSQDEIIETLIRWIDEDQKITPLKALQGLIWQAGYDAGDFSGHVYQDAYEGLQAWHKQGIKLYVFSSGSVKAQKLIFGFSDFGDMTPLFSGYFDTNIGNKREVGAYQNIVKEVGLAANEILFLSDIVEELDAAKSTGFNTIQLVREGEASSTNGKFEHPLAQNFGQIQT